MPTLRNPQHEIFAQGLASGKSAIQAYVAAQYKDNRSGAIRLARNEAVRRRVDELLDERERIYSEGTAAAVERTAIDKQWVIERLVQNVERAMQTVAVKDHEGEPSGEYKYDGSVANRALELLGKELGMFIDRSEVNTVIRDVSDEPISEEDWAKKHATQH